MTAKEYLIIVNGRFMCRKEIYPVPLVLAQVKFVPKGVGKNQKVDFDGDLVNMASDRYKAFAAKGCKCVVCGLEGTYFAKEKSRSSVKQEHKGYHFNLYGIDAEGKEVLITKDHIVPVSKGGGHYLDNYQTMCYNCNMKKGDKLEVEWV